MTFLGWSALIVGIVAFNAFRFHEPLPDCFDDVSTLRRVVLSLKPAINGLAGLAEHAGLAKRTQFQRGVMRLLQKRQPDSEAISSRDMEFDGVPVRVYLPAKRAPHAAALFYVHGGSMVYGDINTYDEVVRTLSLELNLVAVSVDYRLAPEFPFPAAINDVERAFRHFAKNFAVFDVDPLRIAVVGDSAGGNLATVLARRMRDAAESNKESDVPRIKLQILIYPSTQLFEISTVSRLMNLHEFVLPRDLVMALRLQYILGMDFYNSSLRFLAKRYMFGHCFEHRAEFSKKLELAYKNNPKKDDIRERIQSAEDKAFVQLLQSDSIARTRYVQPNCTITSEKELAEAEGRLRNLFDQDTSPLLASLERLPPAFIAYAGSDGLRDDALLYSQRLLDAGVQVFQKSFPEECHGFIQHGKLHKVIDGLQELFAKHAELL